jgi:hypothetical protein
MALFAREWLEHIVARCKPKKRFSSDKEELAYYGVPTNEAEWRQFQEDLKACTNNLIRLAGGPKDPLDMTLPDWKRRSLRLLELSEIFFGTYLRKGTGRLQTLTCHQFL